MKIKRIKHLRVNCTDFQVVWDKTAGGASFNYLTNPAKLRIGVKTPRGTIPESVVFLSICHELMEICAIEMSVRFGRPDCDSDYIFVYDHRQHSTMMEMFAGLLQQFLGD